ncbi:M20/M25/M40 family metallo-hydrolase [Pedobacter sp. PAMC26386]|nr:M20/M25/M40 family metallo-hydrolase [Pedobacter sp. PAMC26386]
MPKFEKISSGLFVLFFMFYGWFIIQELTPPEVVPVGSNAKIFSVNRAFNYLRQVAKEPHSSGTKAHDNVRSYIMNFCKEKGLETFTQEATGLDYNKRGVVSGLAKNIIAKLKGKYSKGTVLVMSHYDSQPNTPGAADNGAAVAAMMETINVLIKGPELNHDVVFLFTDLEESGQLGAESFIHNFKNIADIELVLNFDARGNSGLSYTFETSKDNGKLISEFAKSTDRPIANSLAYEIYQRMPNNTDFTVLKKQGIAGLNTAFIDGYAYYHSMKDTPENLDMKSFQTQGNLMLNTVRHFANRDLAPIQAKDVIFFNPVGHWLWIYPMAWDYPLIIITLLLFVAAIVTGYHKRLISTSDLLRGIGLYLLCILFVFGLTWLLQITVSYVYSYYTNFYGDSFYNIKYYLFVISGLSMFAFILFFGIAGKKIFYYSLVTGGLFILVLLMFAIKIILPSAAYIIYIPLIPFLILLITMILTETNYREHPFRFVFGLMIALLLPLGMWMPFIYILFIVFGLAMPYPAMIFLCFFLPVLLPVKQIFYFIKTKYILISSLGVIIAGLILTHMNSSYSEQRPLQTKLMYGINVDKREAMWVSSQKAKDEWLSQYIKDNKKSLFTEFYPNDDFYVWKSKAVFLDLPAAKMEIMSDTMISDKRKMIILILGTPATNSFDLFLPKNGKLIAVNNRIIKATEDIRQLSFYAPSKEGVKITLELRGKQSTSLNFIERIIGLPAEALKYKLPVTMIYAPGYMSNTTQIKQELSIAEFLHPLKRL